MRAWLYTAAATAVMALGACTPPHPHHGAHGTMRQINALDCPSETGDLRLKGSASPRSCVYDSQGGDEVTLQLIDLNGGDARSAMASTETALQAEVPSAVGDAKAADNTASASATSGGASSSWSSSDDKDRVDIDLPGIHIHGRGDGQADVDTAGVHIRAQDHGRDTGSAQVLVNGGDHAGVVVNAHEGGAQIRVDEPGSGVRLDYVLQSDKPGPHGFRLAAYEARGPSGGPVVVARILGRNPDDEGLRHEVRSLIRENVGG